MEIICSEQLGQPEITVNPPPVSIIHWLGLLRGAAASALSWRTGCPIYNPKRMSWYQQLLEQQTFLNIFAEESAGFSVAILNLFLHMKTKRTPSNMAFNERVYVMNCVSTLLYF